MAVLDSSFLIDVEKGQREATRAFQALASSDEPLLVPVQAALEFAAGVDDVVAALHDLESSMEVVPFEVDHVMEAARLARRARANGKFPGWGDVQIATLAVLRGSYVVTANPGDFTPAGCRVWDYRNRAEPPKS